MRFSATNTYLATAVALALALTATVKPAAAAVTLVSGAGVDTFEDACPHPSVQSTTYIGAEQNVKVEQVACKGRAPALDTEPPAQLAARQSSDPNNVCGAQCNTNCFTPSGGGPNPYDCQVISDALLYDSQNVGALFTIAPTTTNTSALVMSYSSCTSFMVNQASTTLTYCRSDWSSLVEYIAFNCQATQNAHGGNCVAADQRWFIQVNHS